jgi:iron(III) transport system permease protein
MRGSRAEKRVAKGTRTYDVSRVTLPAVKYGLMSAAFVTFTLAITDFGAPKVVGGDYGVLATDIYAKVVGQQNFGMGATVSTVLLIPTAVAFVLDRIVQRQQVAQITTDIVPLAPKRYPALIRGVLFVLCALIAAFILSVYGIVLVGALTTYWPYDLSLTLKHFSEFYVAGAHHGALHVLWNTIKMVLLSSLVGTVVVFSSAYLIERSRRLQRVRAVLYLLSIIPLSIPGTVLGLSYLFAFNDPANPLNILYGTMMILAISAVFHYYTVPFLTATAALRQMDPEFEAVGESLDAPFYRTFWQVIVPLGLPSIISIATYLFLNSLVTLLALVFLFVPGRKVASLMVMFLDDAGETAQAMAMALLILATGLASRGLFTLLTRGVKLRMQAWRSSQSA